jgi:large subunit ribosomal protein L24
MASHVKKGDMVEVIAGDYRGTRGKILSVDLVARKVVVEGVNRSYRHVKRSRRNPQGGRLQVEQPIDISNVLPINPKSDRPTRIRFVIDTDGKKSRVGADGSILDIIRRTIN